MSDAGSAGEWQRLDRRMLVVQPVRAVKDFLPVIIGVLILGIGNAGELSWQLLVIVAPVAWGVLRYFTTRFRISDGRLELRTGLINRQRRSTPLDRIRSVDLTSSPLHRLLGLTAMRIGTGTTTIGDDDLKLDGLSVDTAAALRTELLSRAEVVGDAVGTDPEQPAAAPAAEVVARLDPRWARYAPLTTIGLLAPVAVIAGGAQLLGQVDLGEVLPDHVGFRVGAWLLALAVVVGVVVLALVIPAASYLLSNWDFTLTREPEAWGVRRGLLTTRQTHLDRDRVCGLGVGEALALRWAGGAKVDAIATGTSLLGEDGSALLPAAPRAVADQVAAQVLGTPEPVLSALTPHGSAATRRRWTRALVPAAVVVAVVAVAVALDLVPAWSLAVAVLVPLGASGLALDRSRTLGHALVAGHLVVRSGSLTCSREVLDTRRIIGWQFTASWFQRRAGLVDLAATTAGGSQSVSAPDLPVDLAVTVADAAVPGLVAQFLA